MMKKIYRLFIVLCGLMTLGGSLNLGETGFWLAVPFCIPICVCSLKYILSAEYRNQFSGKFSLIILILSSFFLLTLGRNPIVSPILFNRYVLKEKAMVHYYGSFNVDDLSKNDPLYPDSELPIGTVLIPKEIGYHTGFDSSSYFFVKFKTENDDKFVSLDFNDSKFNLKELNYFNKITDSHLSLELVYLAPFRYLSYLMYYPWFLLPILHII